MINKAFLKNAVVRNASWLIAGKAAQMLIGLIVSLLTARYLGPSNYGLISYATAYTAFFTSVCTLGINSVLVKELVDHPNEEGTVLGTTLVLRIITSFLSALMIVSIVCVIDRDDPAAIWITALCSVSLVFQVAETFHYWFQSRLQSKVTTIAILISYTITSAYKVYLMALGRDAAYFAIAISIDYIIAGTVLLIAYRRYEGQRLAVSWQYGKQLLSRSCYFILPGLMVSIYSQTDKLMLKQFISDAENGYYATAVSICNVWCFVLSAIIDSMYPSIMRAYHRSPYEFAKLNRQLYAMIFYISMCVSALITVFAGPVVSLMYGAAFLPTVLPLRILTWYTAFSYLGVARNAWVVCNHAQKHLIWVYLAAAVANVALNLCLIPRYGAAGAAAASLAAQIVTTLVVPFFVRELRGNVYLMLDAVAWKDVLPR